VKLKSIDRIPDHVRLRIDFNATLTPDEFVRIAATLPRDRIDFIEDPCPYDAATWRGLRDRTGLRLALDRGNGDEDVDVLVVKPAVQEIPSSRAEIVVTSYMDHPLGQLCAAYAAASAGIATTCGLVTHVLYESDAFIERMQIDGARLVPPPGTGFGFDDLLEDLPWRRI
jgi:O-succinylbenzoate synthase